MKTSEVDLDTAARRSPVLDPRAIRSILHTARTPPAPAVLSDGPFLDFDGGVNTRRRQRRRRRKQEDCSGWSRSQ
eukprot:2088423-Pyramimonas_sp.AAC.1